MHTNISLTKKTKNPQNARVYILTTNSCFISDDQLHTDIAYIHTESDRIW